MTRAATWRFAVALAWPIVFAVVVVAGRASASTEYSPALQRDLALASAPKCELCHEAPDGGAVDTRFAQSMKARGLRGSGDVASVRAALDAMKQDRVDSDGDGAFDLDELSYGGDPNHADKPEGASGPAPTWGCAVGRGEGRGIGIVGVLVVMVVCRRSRSRSRSRLRDIAIAIAVAIAFTGCAASAPRSADNPSASSASSSAPPAPPPRVDLTPDKIVDVQPRTVVLAIAMAPLRTHPIGRQLGPLVAAMPQWKDVVQGVLKDPLTDVDWIYMAGPSLASSEKGALLVRHTLPDATIEERLDLLVQRSPSAVPYDLGVTGAKGTLANLGHGGPRVIVRAQLSVIALVPPDLARAVAATLVRSRVLPPLGGAEVLRTVVKEPHRLMRQVPAAITEAYVSVAANDDGSAEITAVGECADDAAATAAADEIRATIHQHNGMIVRMLTKNLLGGVTVTAVGSHVQVHARPTQDQLEATLRIISSMLGVELGR